MPSTLAATCTPDIVMSFAIVPGTLGQLRAALGDKGPLIKCYEGSLTLVSPGRSHESSDRRLGILILAVCAVLKIPHSTLGSTFYDVPPHAGKTGYEPDESYYIQSHGTAAETQPPDLAIEVVVAHRAQEALRIGEVLGIPEIWVWNLPRRELVFHILAPRGKDKGTYRPSPRSRAFPFLNSDEVKERLDDPTGDSTAFNENCRAWAAEVLAPRYRATEAGKRRGSSSVMIHFARTAEE
jgi:Uma2 family endonuclease